MEITGLKWKKKKDEACGYYEVARKQQFASKVIEELFMLLILSMP